MNRFAIDEEDHFEIHVKDFQDEVSLIIKEEDVYNAAEEVMLEAQQE